MKLFKNSLVISLLITVYLSSCGIAEDNQVGLTVYNDNFAVVRDDRAIEFEKGTNEIRFTGVASAIEPSSVNFKCLSSPGAVSILEQNYEYDLVDTTSLLKRYLDKQVHVFVKGSGADVGAEIQGKLAAARGSNLILNRADDIVIVSRDDIERITLAEMPEALVTEPTLVWLAESESESKEKCRITYTTGNIGWNADYSAVVNEDENNLELSGWVTIENNSGTAYKQADVKLIAGDVRRIEAQKPRREMLVMAAGDRQEKAGFEEKSFMDYHMYTLGRQTTVKNNQVKQIELIEPVGGIAYNKRYVYERRVSEDNIQVKIEFQNTESNGLGIPLPEGKVRVFKQDPADENLEFVGEDKIDHTPKKEKLSLYIGNAFDIVPEYTLVDSEQGRRWRRQTHQIKLKNRKDEPVTVFVDEHFTPRMNWDVEKNSHEYEKLSAGKIRFEVNISPDSVETVEYTVRESW